MGEAPTPRTLDLSRLWYIAAASPLGIEISYSSPNDIDALWKARHGLGDPAIRGLSLRRSPFNPAGLLWIVHSSDSIDWDRLGVCPPQVPGEEYLDEI